MRGEHNEIGTVTKIDHKSGMVSLETEKSKLELHFEPGTIKGVNAGDTLNIQLGYTVTEHKPKRCGERHSPRLVYRPSYFFKRSIKTARAIVVELDVTHAPAKGSRQLYCRTPGLYVPQPLQAHHLWQPDDLTMFSNKHKLGRIVDGALEPFLIV